MAIAIAERQVTWPTAVNTANVTAEGNATSEEIDLPDNCIDAEIQLKAEYTTAAPASDDIIYFWLLRSHGDPDGSGSDEFDTPPQAAGETGGAALLAVADLNKGETSGSGKKILISKKLPVTNKTMKLYAEGLTGSTTNTITVSATITEKTA